MNLFIKKNSIFALDVSGSSFKILQLGKQGSATAIQAYSDTPMPKGLLVNDDITDAKAFGQLLRQALQKPRYGRIDTRYAAVSLPESKSFVRVIQIPVMSDKEAENAVPFEAENFIPMPIDQVYLDWQKISEKNGRMNILIMASPKDFVDKYLSILDGAGITAAALEVESQSCRRALLDFSSTETSLIIDLDAFRSSMIMVEDGSLQFTSSIPVAGNTFTEAIAKALSIAPAKAEEIKQQVGISNTAEYPNIRTSVMPVLNNLSSEIKNILNFHTDHSEKQVSKIILAGGSAKLKNLAEFLQPEFADYPGLQVTLGNPWINFTGLTANPMDIYESLSFVTAIGLAMRGRGDK